MMQQNYKPAIVAAEQPPGENAGPTVASSARSSFWSRNHTIINFWLDVLLLILFLVQAWMFSVLHIVFPRGAGQEWRVWGATPIDWSESLFQVFCFFSIGVVVHVMFHWNWICGVVTTRLLGRKNRKDDGSNTLVGVGLLVIGVHMLAVGILAAKMALVGPS